MATASGKELTLRRKSAKVTRELAELNRELAKQMILLAGQTGDTMPLVQAVNTLRSVQELYSIDTTPRENAEVQKDLGDTLLKIGQARDDVSALEHAIRAYRGAITIASMLGDETMRRDLKRNYGIARNLLGSRSSDPSLRGAA